MDLHEHLKRARAKIKPLTKEQLSKRGKRAIQIRWKKYKAEKRRKNPTAKSTSAPRMKVKRWEEYDKERKEYLRKKATELCDFSSDWDSEYCLTHNTTNGPLCTKNTEE